ncbi:MAG: Bifunctional NAD(P)H-hydrate repair enzyme Nnr [Deltaproteobacteria bacterium]|jgi:NAD(P)H-hydrate epimerase|nr:Bifunctional NAD(P)H-hydrate repair enzyme Nnr [Deltaproteobacteria bacterium]
MDSQDRKLIRLADARSMREMDRHAIEDLGISGAVLMENAARSVADWLEENKLKQQPEAKVVVCCGKGNNGGDGFAIARLLANRGYNISVVDAGKAGKKDALQNQLLWEQFGVSASFPDANATRMIVEADVLIDAIFGVGMEQPIEGAYKEWIEIFNSNNNALKIAVDIPSGVSTDESRILGVAARCQHTITFQAGKPGCFQHPGAQYSGKVLICDISIPEHLPESVSIDQDEPERQADIHSAGTYLLTKEFIRDLIPERLPDSHKGNFGHLITVCGSAGMGGAANLASMAALKSGAGLVTACVPNELLDRLPGQAPEIMTVTPHNAPEYFTEEHADFVEQLAEARDAVVLGCGLGVHSQTTGFVQQLTKQLEGPLLIDADGLNNLDEETLKERHGTAVITPHPRELSRLSGQSVSEIQENRISTVRRLSQEWNVVLLLKGALTVIGSPDANIFINPTGNSALSTAGSGDVLSGFIGGFLAQGLSPLYATLTGTYLHGLAAECFVQQTGSNYMVASDLFEGLPLARNAIKIH